MQRLWMPERGQDAFRCVSRIWTARFMLWTSTKLFHLSRRSFDKVSNVLFFQAELLKSSFSKMATLMSFGAAVCFITHLILRKLFSQ